MDRAIREGLGAGWRTAIEAGTTTPPRRHRPWARVLFMPFLVRRRDVERVVNIRYDDAGRSNLLDVYRHRSRPSGGPVLVYLHGGRFRSGRKSREARPLIYRFASQGWVCISANYRLSPAARFPDHHVDAKKVIAWVREHGHEYGADPATVFVVGSSAGGHLAAMAALAPNDPVFQPGFERADTSVVAAICLYGYYGSLDADERIPSSPLAYVRADAPPFFVTHGDKDTLVLVEDARNFVQRLRRISSNPGSTRSCPGGSTRSTCSTRSASRRSSTESKPSPPGSDRAGRSRPCWAPVPASGHRGIAAARGHRWPLASTTCRHGGAKLGGVKDLTVYLEEGGLR